jgi:Fe-S cluster assembly scaffold protein SufB
MKNVENAHYLQIDNKIERISERRGVVILPSLKAWQNMKWTRKWFQEKPKEGYFVWIKQKLDFPLITCVTIASPKVSQNLINLLIIEKGIKAKASIVCNAKEKNLQGIHKARGKLILKEGAKLEYKHFHQWGNKDFVNPEYEFILEKNSCLNYIYKNPFSPQNLILKSWVQGGQDSCANLTFLIKGKNSNIKIRESVFLKKRNARGVARLRLVAQKNSKISAYSQIVADAESKGHLDCQGILIDTKSEIALTPELICNHKKAQITHEASIGKISEEQINYLRTRGLGERESIDLIVSGFLKI